MCERLRAGLRFTAFTLTAFGVMMAARIKQIQAFMALTQMLVMPLFFLCGALYPLRGLPGWLTVLTRLDPLTYIVYPMRHAVFSLSKAKRSQNGAAQSSSHIVAWGESVIYGQGDGLVHSVIPSLEGLK